MQAAKPTRAAPIRGPGGGRGRAAAVDLGRGHHAVHAAADVHARQGVLHAGRLDYVCSGTALLSGNKSVVWTAGHCVNEGPGDFATNWEFVPAYKDGTRAARRLRGDEPVHQLRVGEQRRLQLRLRRRGRRARGRDRAHRPRRRSRDLVQLQPLADTTVLRLSGGAAVQRRAPVDLQFAAADQRQLGQPGDDGHRLRHDRRLQRRRLDRRQQPVLGELLRVLQPAERDVRARTWTASRSRVYNAAAAG